MHEHRPHLTHLPGKRGLERLVGDPAAFLAQPSEHLPLRGDDLVERPVHHHHAVFLIPRQVRHELRHHLHHLPAGVGHPRSVDGQPAGEFVFEVAALVACIGRTVVVGEDGHAPRGEHLHHHRRARPRQPRHHHHGFGPAR